MENLEKLRTDVTDLLNQLMVKLEPIGKVKTYEDYDYGTRVVDSDTLRDRLEWDEDLSEKEKEELKKELSINETEQYLACTKAMIKRALEGTSSVIYNENQYYNSNC